MRMETIINVIGIIISLFLVFLTATNRGILSMHGNEVMRLYRNNMTFAATCLILLVGLLVFRVIMKRCRHKPAPELVFHIVTVL